MKYEIEGHIVETEKPLSTDEIDDIAANLGSKKDSNSSSMWDVAKSAIGTALPSPDFNKPIEGQTQGGLMDTPLAALKAAGQTLSNPTRISPTVSAPGQAAGDAVENKLTNLGAPGYIAKPAGFVTGMILDPQTYMLGGLKAPASKAGKLSEIATQEANKSGSIMPRTIENMTRTGESAADKAGQVGKMLLDDGVLKTSATETEKAAISKLKESGQAVGKALGDIAKASKQVTGQAIDAEVEHGVGAHEALKPLNETLQGFADSVTGARKALAKPFEDVKIWLMSKAENQNGQLTLDNVKHVMDEIGPMTHKGAEDVQLSMSELYGTLAKMRDGMVEKIAADSGNPQLGANLLKANSKYSTYLHILPDIQRNAVKEALGKGPGLAEPVKYLTKKAAPLVAKLATKADNIASSTAAQTVKKDMGLAGFKLMRGPEMQSILDTLKKD